MLNPGEQSSGHLHHPHLSPSEIRTHRAMDVQAVGEPLATEAFEMTPIPLREDSQPGSPTKAQSAQSSMVALRAADPQEGTTVQELPPIDGGSGAWIFCASAFVVEMMIWGFSFRYSLLSPSHPRVPTELNLRSYGIFQGTVRFVGESLYIHAQTIEYYTSHPPFNTASPVSIAAVGTVMLAFLYGEVRSSHRIIHDWGGG